MMYWQNCPWQESLKDLKELWVSANRHGGAIQDNKKAYKPYNYVLTLRKAFVHDPVEP